MASGAYRRSFVDIGSVARLVATVAPGARSVLDLGCGEGAVTEALVASLPDAEVVGVDPAAVVGRSYRGPERRVRFVQASVADYLSSQSGRFDVVVVCDVLHHVPRPERSGLLTAARDLVKPGGVVVVKDWEHRGDLVTRISGLVERRLSGATVVDYPTMTQLVHLVREVFGADYGARLTRLPPWSNNVAIVISASPV